MARKKIYQVSPTRREQARTATPVPDAPARPSAVAQLASTGDARIDMVALLGPKERFAHNRRVIDFNVWLGRGIDAWVWSVLVCLRAWLLSGARETSTVSQDSQNISYFFEYLTQGRRALSIASPTQLLPSHVKEFTGWLAARGRRRGLTKETVRSYYKNVKAVLKQMFELDLIPGDPSQFFERKALPWGSGESKQTSLSEAEQERMASAIKTDLASVYHRRLILNPGEIQGLRLLLVGHRQGGNPTPLLELRRDAVAPGLIPGTIRVATVKFRNRKMRASVGRAGSGESKKKSDTGKKGIGDAVFGLAEGAVLQQAIKDTEALVEEAPPRIKNRVWLYRTGENQKSVVTCLSIVTLALAIKALIERHKLLGDDGKPLRINFSRTRKSFFDRALRVSDGDLGKTSNLMGNSRQVAASNYPSINEERKAEAAEFLNEDYIDVMRGGATATSKPSISPKVIRVVPVATDVEGRPLVPLESTPVSGCKDSLNGEFAPRDGRTHCDRYIMCLFCSSFAIVGTVDEIWRLFSFQVFAMEELKYLDSVLGPERTKNDDLEDLRDRYRIAIPYIDQFTKRQFPASVVKAARKKTEERLHPFWVHQMKLSRRARARMPGRE
ncbi:hypothetical protein OKW45_005524 [Paraburkholderia sp. WSM4175]|uniref:phage integrase SAM-like domain-containing protein n=1 Tax=Paraburkholderia sp. WSM4175 TaxID=2991072 RepID=UPI003D2629FB